MAYKNYASPDPNRTSSGNAPAPHAKNAKTGREIEIPTQNNSKMLAIIIAAIVIVGVAVLVLPNLFAGEVDVPDYTDDVVIEDVPVADQGVQIDEVEDIASRIIGTWVADTAELVLNSDGTGTITTEGTADLTWEVQGYEIAIISTQGQSQKAIYDPDDNTIEISGVKFTRQSSSRPHAQISEAPEEPEQTETIVDENGRELHALASSDQVYKMKIIENSTTTYNVTDGDDLEFLINGDGTCSIAKNGTTYASNMTWTTTDDGKNVISGMPTMSVNVPNNFIYMLKNESADPQVITQKDGSLFLPLAGNAIVVKLYKD